MLGFQMPKANSKDTWEFPETRGRHDKDDFIWGSILGSPSFWKLPLEVVARLLD